MPKKKLKKNIKGEPNQASIKKKLKYRLLCSYDKLIHIDDLHLNPENPNDHPETQIALLAQVMKTNGVRRPIRVSTHTGLVTAGHGQILSSRVNGWDYLPVDFQDYKNEADEFNDVVADNALAQMSKLDYSIINKVIVDLGPNFNVADMGLPDFKIEPADNDSNSGGNAEDDLPDKVVKRCKKGDLWALGDHFLLCGDALKDIKKLISSKKIDMVFTDPPYGADIVKVKSIGGDKVFGSKKQSKGKLRFGTVIGESNSGKRILKAGRYKPVIGDKTTQTAIESFKICQSISKNLFFWGAQYYAEVLPPSSGWVVWDKQTSGFFGDGELAYTSHKKAIRIFVHQWSGLIKASERTERRCHPTQKPIALAEWAFEKYGDPKTVLDPFGGSGSTLMACEKSKRKCFMLELDPHYCNIILQRYEKLFNKKVKKINGIKSRKT